MPDHALGLLPLGPDPDTPEETRAVAGDGRRVSLVALPSIDSSTLDRIGAVLDAAADVAHEHLAPPMMLAGDGRALVLPLGDRGSLASVPSLGRSGGVGELVTVVWPVAHALAEAHSVGQVHGALTEARILLSRDGRPTVAGLGQGVALAEAAGSPAPGPESDIRALAAIVLDRIEPVEISPTSPRAGGLPHVADGVGGVDFAAAVDCLRRAVSATGPSGTDLGVPTMADVAAAIACLARPKPVPAQAAALHGGARAYVRQWRRARPDRRRQRRDGRVAHGAGAHGAGVRGAGARARRVLVAGCLAAVAVALVAIAWVGPTSPSRGPAAIPCSDPPSPDEAERSPDRSGEEAATSQPDPRPLVDWAAETQRLHDRRAFAFRTADPTALCEVYVPSSPGLQRDLHWLARLREADAAVRDGQFVVTAAEEVAREGDKATVRITDSLGSHRVHAGSDVSERTGLPEQTWLATLVLGIDGQWRFG